MGVIILVFTVTAFWIIFGVGGPFIVPKGPNRSMLSAFRKNCVFWIFEDYEIKLLG